MAAAGNYIIEDDIDNFPETHTEAQKQTIIDRIEELVEKISGDYFYERDFDIYVDGNGENKLFLPLMPDVLYVSSIKIAGVTLNSDYWTFNKNSVYRDPGDVLTDVELRWLLKQYRGAGLFPEGIGNIRIAGTFGWPERLDIDNISGAFEVFEQITGGSSGATAIIKEIHATYLKIAGRAAVDFTEDEKITGGDSEATANVDNADGAVNDPPEAIIEACIILIRNENDDTIYTHYIQGREQVGAYLYDTKVEPLTGIKEVDNLLKWYVGRKPAVAVV